MAITPPRSRGRDGKSYPRRQPSQAERLHVAGRVHQLHCVDGWSLEGVRFVLAEEGIVRSNGAISADLRRWHCAHCDPAPPPVLAPPQQPEPEPAHQQPGHAGGGWAGPGPPAW
jgi:hypothetical protein